MADKPPESTATKKPTAPVKKTVSAVKKKEHPLLKYISLVLLSVWLITQGLSGVFKIDLLEGKLLPILNLVVGAFLVLFLIRMKRGELGLLLLGVWSLLQSSLFLFHVSFSFSNTIVHVLGMVAGILLILKI